MTKDSIHYGGWEHRDVHNINGMLFVSCNPTLAQTRIASHDLLHSLIIRGKLFMNGLTLPSGPSFSLARSMPAPNGLVLCGQVTILVLGSIWLLGSRWSFQIALRV